jgi:membrane protease YdiL (CAAX protease family)
VCLVFLTGLLILGISASIAQALAGSSPASTDPPWMIPALTHFLILLSSLITSAVLSKGKLSQFGFCLKLAPISLKVVMVSLGIGLVANILLVILGIEADLARGYGAAAIVGLVWIWASICEEALCRGLLQTMFGRALRSDRQSRSWRPSAQVVLGATFFSLMHLPVVMIGVPVGALLILLPTAFLLGCIAGRVREDSRSILPAILVHALFNIAGSISDLLPM